tara:strand:- start:209 stop:1138 length:930 start_codon:yes stop_codon:yes gene_type:complete
VEEKKRLAYLGPAGTFTEQALYSQPDLVELALISTPSILEVLKKVNNKEVDLGFVAIENSIEGSVNITQDTLAFDAELLIQREVVTSIEMNLLAPKGTQLKDIKTIVSFPHAIAQCKEWLSKNLPDAVTEAANSTADAAEQVSQKNMAGFAAIGTKLAADTYGLELIKVGIEDYSENETRFVLVAPDDVPAPTGQDKTSIVVFQDADRPGSLLSILQEFAARSLNLTRLESRPTRQGLGNYCFLIDLKGHISDEIVADCLKNLHMKNGSVKFLGSYPSASADSDLREKTSVESEKAENWLDNLRNRIRK